MSNPSCDKEYYRNIEKAARYVLETIWARGPVGRDSHCVALLVDAFNHVEPPYSCPWCDHKVQYTDWWGTCANCKAPWDRKHWLDGVHGEPPPVPPNENPLLAPFGTLGRPAQESAWSDYDEAFAAWKARRTAVGKSGE